MCHRITRPYLQGTSCPNPTRRAPPSSLQELSKLHKPGRTLTQAQAMRMATSLRAGHSQPDPTLMRTPTQQNNREGTQPKLSRPMPHSRHPRPRDLQNTSSNTEETGREREKLHLAAAHATGTFIELLVRCRSRMSTFDYGRRRPCFRGKGGDVWLRNECIALEDSILQCLSPPIFFVLRICMSGWRPLDSVTVHVYCILHMHCNFHVRMESALNQIEISMSEWPKACY
jgi:hypothetical protein